MTLGSSGSASGRHRPQAPIRRPSPRRARVPRGPPRPICRARRAEQSGRSGCPAPPLLPGPADADGKSATRDAGPSPAAVCNLIRRSSQSSATGRDEAPRDRAAGVFGIGPAGGAPDGYGLGRGAARCDIGRTDPGGATCPHGIGRRRIDCSGPGGATSTARAGRRRVDRPGLLRVTSQDATILMSAHAPPPGPIRARV